MYSDPLAVDIHAAFASRYEGRGMGSRSLRPPLFFAGMQCRSKCYGGWPNRETCAVLEDGRVFSDPLAVD